MAFDNHIITGLTSCMEIVKIELKSNTTHFLPSSENCYAVDSGVTPSPESTLCQCSLSTEESGGRLMHQAESSEDDDDSAALSLKTVTVC